MSVRYRNTETGSVSTYATAIPRLEQSDQWERIDDVDTVTDVDSGDDADGSDDDG